MSFFYKINLIKLKLQIVIDCLPHVITFSLLLGFVSR